VLKISNIEFPQIGEWFKLFLDYLKEKTGKDSLEIKDKGFITYSYTNLGKDKAVYIEDIYIIPKLRKTGIMLEMIQRIYKESKDKGCVVALGSVQIETNNPEISVRLLLDHGMKILKNENQKIWFWKEL